MHAAVTVTALQRHTDLHKDKRYGKQSTTCSTDMAPALGMALHSEHVHK